MATIHLVCVWTDKSFKSIRRYVIVWAFLTFWQNAADYHPERVFFAYFRGWPRESVYCVLPPCCPACREPWAWTWLTPPHPLSPPPSPALPLAINIISSNPFYFYYWCTPLTSGFPSSPKVAVKSSPLRKLKTWENTPRSRPSKQCEFCNHFFDKSFISQCCQSGSFGQSGGPDG